MTPPIHLHLHLHLVLLLLLLVTTTTTTATSLPKFQHLNIKQTLKLIAQPTKPHAPAPTTQGKALDIIHRDALLLPSPTPLNHSALLYRRLRRDAARVAALNRRLSPTEFGSGVVSGLNQGSGEYFVRIGVGSPARPQYLVLDSGSDVVWVQCQPCTLCYNQSDPVFDPSLSSSFSPLPCDAHVCGQLDSSACLSNQCRYQILYNDGSFTKGTLALETLTIGDALIRDVAIGCGHSNHGLFLAASGLLGLGSGPLSLINQLGGQTGGAFSYCLPTRSSTSSSSSLQFGRDSLPVGAAWIALIQNPLAPSFYYVSLSGIDRHQNIIFN